MVAVTLACLSAPVGLAAVGSTFRIAARMADDNRTLLNVAFEPPVRAAAVVGAHAAKPIPRQ